MIERRGLPLFARRASRRDDPTEQTRGRGVGLGASAAIVLLAATTAIRPAPRLVWNVSPSAPLGLYLVSPGAPIARGDMVIARLPRRIAALAAARHYLPAGVPLVKRVAAVAGTLVCARGTLVSIDGQRATTRRRFDAKGRAMPWWTGCRSLRRGEVFLLMAHVQDSFDGRYLGPTRASDIIGKGRLLWAR